MNNEEKMVLLINGEEAVRNMEVKTFRDETYILTDWRAPGENMGGQNGKVYCKSQEDFDKNRPYANEWYPSVIGGEFVRESKLLEEKMKIEADKKHTEEINQQMPKRRGR